LSRQARGELLFFLVIPAKAGIYSRRESINNEIIIPTNTPPPSLKLWRDEPAPLPPSARQVPPPLKLRRDRQEKIIKRKNRS